MSIISITSLPIDIHDKLMLFITNPPEKIPPEQTTINLTDPIRNYIKTLTNNTSAFIKNKVSFFVNNTKPIKIALSRSEVIRFILYDWYNNRLESTSNTFKDIKESLNVLDFLREELPYEPTIVRVLNEGKSVKRNMPWEYTKPKKLLNLFHKDINLRLTLSHIYEQGKCTPLKLKELMGYNSGMQYSDVNTINRTYPGLIKKARKDGDIKKTSRILYYIIDQAVLMPLLS